MNFKILKHEGLKVLNFLDFSFLKEEKLHPFFTTFSFASLFNKEIVIFYNKNSENVILIPKELPLAFIDFCNLYFRLNEANLEDAFFMINLAEKINFNEEQYFKLFEVVDWPPHKKGIYYFENCKNFSLLLRKNVFNKKISFKEATYFYNTFKEQNYDKILEILPDSLTFSEKEHILRNISDFARREKKDVKNIVAILKANSDLLESSFKLKFPEYSKVLENFYNFLKVTKIEKSGKLKFDKTFEKEDYIFEINFRNLNELRKKLLDAIKNIDEYQRNDGIDYFQHINLFYREKFNKDAK